MQIEHCSRFALAPGQIRFMAFVLANFHRAPFYFCALTLAMSPFETWQIINKSEPLTGLASYLWHLFSFQPSLQKDYEHFDEKTNYENKSILLFTGDRLRCHFAVILLLSQMEKKHCCFMCMFICQMIRFIDVLLEWLSLIKSWKKSHVDLFAEARWTINKACFDFKSFFTYFSRWNFEVFELP